LTTRVFIDGPHPYEYLFNAKPQKQYNTAGGKVKLPAQTRAVFGRLRRAGKTRRLAELKKAAYLAIGNFKK
jgi:hypothetical protein